jgi:tripartite-type tricarboxylate transporter receptor subunit TctC
MGARLSTLALAALAATVATAASAQYPTQSIRIIVSTAPGGAPDVAARLLTDRLASVLGQPVVVENRTGADRNVAGNVVSRSAADGHTLLMAAGSDITVNPHVYRRMAFDALKDLVPVASIYRSQFVLTVHPSVPATTLPEFVAYARKADPPLRYASAGPGSMHHLGIEMLKQRASINLSHVPYPGALRRAAPRLPAKPRSCSPAAVPSN